MDPDRLHEHEKPQAPQHKPDAVEDPAAPLKELVSGVGNRAFSSTVARQQGHGIRDNGEVDSEVQSSINASRGSGSTLDANVAGRMSSSLGDLSDVRVHTDSRAGELNHAVSARAFATGSDVYFAPGEYKPNTTDGDRLIAHELAHVVQQRGASTSGPLSVSQPGDSMEREADSVADTIA